MRVGLLKVSWKVEDSEMIYLKWGEKDNILYLEAFSRKGILIF